MERIFAYLFCVNFFLVVTAQDEENESEPKFRYRSEVSQNRTTGYLLGWALAIVLAIILICGVAASIYIRKGLRRRMKEQRVASGQMSVSPSTLERRSKIPHDA
eukprot:m.339834 g.339834  ORF g.339834 m.339834 type:complete len:104 (-) comp18991_c0_seq1:87-398(-)